MVEEVKSPRQTFRYKCRDGSGKLIIAIIEGDQIRRLMFEDATEAWFLEFDPRDVRRALRKFRDITMKNAECHGFS